MKQMSADWLHRDIVKETSDGRRENLELLYEVVPMFHNSQPEDGATNDSVNELLKKKDSVNKCV